MDKLNWAIKARSPIIQCKTKDTAHVMDYLAWIAGETVYTLENTVIDVAGLDTDEVYAAIGGVLQDPVEAYRTLTDNNQIMVLINCEDDDVPMAVQVGEVGYDWRYTVSLFKDYPNIKKVGPILDQIPPSDARTILRMCLHEDGKITMPAVQRFRNLIDGFQSGLYIVPELDSYHHPDHRVEKWLTFNSNFFMNSPIPELKPRGLLLAGPAGTGKTQCAKYIAQKIGVTLFHLEIGGMLSKWVGESEENLQQCLARLDANAPCVVLIDEVEKLFSREDDDGIGQRMLAQLLWWMAEHRSSVLTIMTTNNIKRLPVELYRSGRIDNILEFQGLDVNGGTEFAKSVLVYMTEKYVTTNVKFPTKLEVQQQLSKVYKKGTATNIVMTQADLLKFVLKLIKHKNI